MSAMFDRGRFEANVPNVLKTAPDVRLRVPVVSGCTGIPREPAILISKYNY